MAFGSKITRRTLGRALAAPALIKLSQSLALPAFAQGAPATTGNEAWKQVHDLAARARDLKVGSPRFSVAPTGGAAEDALLALLDLLDRLDAQIDKGNTGDPEALRKLEALRKEAGDLRRKLNADAKGGRSELDPKGPNVTRGAAISSQETRYKQYKDEYIRLFNSCEIKASKERAVAQTVAHMLEAKHQAAYKAVADENCVPWYFVGLAHGLEADFDLKAHLHNGDPLEEQTVQVPKGRPDPWNPPSDWVSSALDALHIEHFDNRVDWDLAHVLFRLEAYNGWGYRKQGINSPYLWSYSNHYIKGKYVRDGVYDSEAVSTQPGSAVMLKYLVNTNVVQLVA